MRYTGFFPYSLFPIPYSLFPVPCSLKPKNLYLTQLQTAVNHGRFKLLFRQIRRYTLRY
ncbi:MAG: hypothetical protein F6K56_43170 [Moorea sp. SIO3G5]|nr:hypothetical protein [Moorena sp. SIO3G5]